jgi:hypothetical protein
MNTTQINLVLEWARAPAAFRLEFDHARVMSGGINLGWGTHDKVSHRFTFTSTDEMCRICFGLEADGTEDTGIPAVVRVVDTEMPFTVNISDLLKQKGGELLVAKSGVKLYAEVDWFAML